MKTKQNSSVAHNHRSSFLGHATQVPAAVNRLLPVPCVFITASRLKEEPLFRTSPNPGEGGAGGGVVRDLEEASHGT